jgi:protein-S-isoprenylcysteine O-methyltransferase Ste14
MIEVWLIILIHQLIFQGMFLAKNILLSRKTGKQIRGKNKEANISILFFILFIGLSLVFGYINTPLGEVELLNSYLATTTGLLFLFLSLALSAISLLHLKDSWRVGVVEDQKTKLVQEGVYRFTRNPYFVSYLLIFAAYTLLLQNVILLGLSLLGFSFIHKMIVTEEKYLQTTHGDSYLKYKQRVPRYLIK